MESSSDNTALNEDAFVQSDRPQDSAAPTQSSRLKRPRAKQQPARARIALTTPISKRASTTHSKVIVRPSPSSHPSLKSMSSAINPLDLPEVREQIKEYLEPKDLALCIRVCRDWYRSFLPGIWENILLLPGRYNSAALQNHRHFIRGLSILGTPGPETANLICPKLERLFIFAFRQGDTTAMINFVVRHNSSPVHTVGLMGTNVDWQALSKLPHLKKLNVSGGVADIIDEPATLQLFWDTCARVETLSLTRLVITSLQGLPQLFPNLKTLDIDFWSILMTDDSRIELARRCPNLENLFLLTNALPRPPSIHLDGAEEEPAVQTLVRLATAGTWPRLQGLAFEGCDAQDQDVVQLLSAMQKCVTWHLSRAKYEPASFLALLDHASTLESLKLERSPTVTSGMIQRILTTCTRLKVFTGNRIRAQDIVESDSGWVCNRLKVLTLFIDFESPLTSASLDAGVGVDAEELERQVQKKVFEQLSALKSIETLAIGYGHLEKVSLTHAQKIADTVIRHGLDLRLCAGLGKLGDLKKLWHLDCNAMRQQMEEEDVDWMIQHWKGLREIVGPLNTRDHKLNVRLEKEFKHVDITVQGYSLPKTRKKRQKTR
ncbi:hypothetical protein EDD11_009828 [Mortierella claussenii]|nr:hypothetical protein EDD11_009828 [Mortierella claussenii]